MSEFWTRKSHEQFVDELKEINPNITVIGKYVTRKIKIRVRCNICGYEWDANPGDMISKKSGCPKCGRKRATDKTTKTTEQFIEEMRNVNQNIKILGEYTKGRLPIKCECLICGNVWETSTPNNLLRGHGCPKCGNVAKKTTEEFKEDLSKITKDIEVLGEYKNNKTPILCRCKICGYEWSAKPNNLLCGMTGCPACNTSKGERVITNYLRDRNIKYTTEKKYEGLVGLEGRPLRYDFFIPQINTLIEYQGGYHDGSGTGVCKQSDEEKLKQMEHDRRKRKYVMQHNIPLIEIWYYDYDNIVKILDQRLKPELA